MQKVMREYEKYRLLLIAVAGLCTISCYAISQEKPLPPLLEMMSRTPLQSSPPPEAKKKLIPLEILTASPQKPAAAEQVPSASTGAPVLQQDEPVKRKIPTLREQLQTVENKQKEQYDTNEDLRKEISDIKRSISDLRHEVANIAADKKESAYKGKSYRNENSLPEINSAREQRKKPNKNVILPDGGDKGGEDKKVSKAVVNSGMELPARTSTKSKITSSDKPVPEVESSEQDTPHTTPYGEAMNLISKKKYGDAIPFLQQTLQSDKSAAVQSGCYYWLGESNFGLGKYEEAIKNFQKVGVLKTSSKLDDAQLMIAESYYRKGDVVSAKAAFQRLINIFPRSEYVARARKMLQEL